LLSFRLIVETNIPEQPQGQKTGDGRCRDAIQYVLRHRASTDSSHATTGKTIMAVLESSSLR
jgi:hypothetical protein